MDNPHQALMTAKGCAWVACTENQGDERMREGYKVVCPDFPVTLITSPSVGWSLVLNSEGGRCPPSVTTSGRFNTKYNKTVISGLGWCSVCRRKFTTWLFSYHLFALGQFWLLSTLGPDIVATGHFKFPPPLQAHSDGPKGYSLIRLRHSKLGVS